MIDIFRDIFADVFSDNFSNVFGSEITISGSITLPIYTVSFDVLFTELIDPLTVTNVGDGSGSFELYNTTLSAWVAGVVSTLDNLTFTFTPTVPLTPASNYEIFLSTAILGSTTGREYSGENFIFSASVLSNASLHDDDCSDITTDWDEFNAGNGTTTQVAYLGDETFEFTDTGYDAANLSRVSSPGSLFATPTTLVFSAGIRQTGLSTFASGLAYFDYSIRFNALGVARAGMRIYSDKIHLSFDSGATVDYAFTEGQRIISTLVITAATGLADIYMDNAKIATGVDVTGVIAAGTEGVVQFNHRDKINQVDRAIVHVDIIDIGNGLK